VLLFATTGIANGSTFRQISVIFMNIGQPEQAGPVLGWSSAIASYGAAIIPGYLIFRV
jgi:NNP family nitrate/nitrite transporter-like MFS transporter